MEMNEDRIPRIVEILDKMLNDKTLGLQSAVLRRMAFSAISFVGMYDLLVLWDQETDKKERQLIIKDLKEVTEDIWG